MPRAADVAVVVVVVVVVVSRLVIMMLLEYRFVRGDANSWGEKWEGEGRGWKIDTVFICVCGMWGEGGGRYWLIGISGG